MADFLGNSIHPTSSCIGFGGFHESLLQKLKNDGLTDNWRGGNSAFDTSFSDGLGFTDMDFSSWNPNFDRLHVDSGPMSIGSEEHSGELSVPNGNDRQGTMQDQIFYTPLASSGKFFGPNTAPAPQRIESKPSAFIPGPTTFKPPKAITKNDRKSLVASATRISKRAKGTPLYCY